MKINTLLYSLGLKKTPKYSYNFAANNPFTGMFFHVRFSDGKSGLVCDRRNGTYVPQVKLIPRDSKMVFVSFDDAAKALYRGLIENGNPFAKKNK